MSGLNNLGKIKAAIERLSPKDRKTLEEWFRNRSALLMDAKPSLEPAKRKGDPRAVNRKLLPGFRLERIPRGWKGKFPGRPELFGKPVLLIAETQEEYDFSKLPPPLSSFQAELVHKIMPALPQILKRAKKEVESIGIDPPEEGEKVPLNIYVWLHWRKEEDDDDDGRSWDFVVERADGSDFGYHLAYQGTKFIESWAGD